MGAGLLIALIAVLAVSPAAGLSQSAPSNPQVPKGKQTKLGLYVTAKEAYEKWQAEPEKVKILDVRTPEEYLFVGHPEMAWNVPLLFQTFNWDSDRERFAMEPNQEFVARVKELFKPDDTVLIMCRSGGRSAVSVNLLAEAGFTKVYTVTDGMEGDLVKDPGNLYDGQRMKNGWKNSGLPWTYQPNPERMRVSKPQ